MRKKIFTFALALAITVSAFSGMHIAGLDSSFAETAEPVLEGEGAILIDATSGEILYSKNADKQFEPASTTKMTTCILALENLDPEELIPIDQEISFTEGSRIYLLEGEQITAKDVVYGLMLESANDSAIAIGKAISGTTDEFVKLMNEKVKEIGAKNTNYVNPNGLHVEGHLSTPYDLAMIARYCMKNEDFRKIVSTYQYTVAATNLQDTRYFHNTNRLLYDVANEVVVNGVSRICKYDGILGIKTGYTSHAGGCLVAAAQRNGTTLIAAVMKSSEMGRFADCIALMDWGFENYYSYKVDLTGDSEALTNAGIDVSKGEAAANSEAAASEDDSETAASDAVSTEDESGSTDTGEAALEVSAATFGELTEGRILGSVKVRGGAVKSVLVRADSDTYSVTLPKEASKSVITTKITLDKVKAPLEEGQQVGKISVLETGDVIAEIPIRATAAVEKGGVLSNIGISDSIAKVIWIVLTILAVIVVVLWLVLMELKRRHKKRKKARRAQKAMEIAMERHRKQQDQEQRKWPY